MKQIVLILLFVFTIQISIHKYKPLEDEQHNKGSSYKLLSPKTKCEPGYYKKCMVIGMYIKTHNLPKRCFCYKIKSEKSSKVKTTKEINTKNVTTKDIAVKDQTTKISTSKDKTLKDFEITGKPVKVFENSSYCKQGEFYVCYDMMTSRFFKRKFTQCHCSKTRY